MAHTFGGNRICVGDGDPCFVIATNLTNWFEIGTEHGDGHWLRAEIVGEDNDFIFNGRLFLPAGGGAGTIIDNFPKGPIPDGWIRVHNVRNEGYELVSKADDTVLFGYEIVDSRYCHVAANIYGVGGQLVARTTKDDLQVHIGPATIGRTPGGGVGLSIN